MSSIRPEMTLAQLVNEDDRLAPVLERLGLDYCCGGQQRLAEAAQERGLDLDAVVATLESTAGARDVAAWSQMGLGELIDHIVGTHHAYLDDALPRLDALASKVADVHGGRHPELVDVLRIVQELRAELEPHLRKEEQVLFPWIRKIDAARSTTPSSLPLGVRHPVAVMTSEHERAGELLSTLRTATDEFRIPDDGCASYRALYAGLEELEQDTHLHVHKENNLLFPAAVAAERALAEMR